MDGSARSLHHPQRAWSWDDGHCSGLGGRESATTLPPESTQKVYKCRRDDQIFAVKAIGLSRCVRPALPCCIMCISCVNTALARKGCRCSATKKRPWNDCAESQEPIVFASQLHSPLAKLFSLWGEGGVVGPLLMLMTGSAALGSID